jgi:predicted DCC family thiol-disulfide oxidoreductase YuxK
MTTRMELTGRQRPTVLYDGSCRICTAQARNLERLSRGRADALAVQEALHLFPALSEAEALREIKLVMPDGRVHGGVAALVELVLLGRPVAGRLLALYYLPGIRQLADQLYAWLARNRYRLGGRVNLATCDSRTCGLREAERGARRSGLQGAIRVRSDSWSTKKSSM